MQGDFLMRNSLFKKTGPHTSLWQGLSGSPKGYTWAVAEAPSQDFPSYNMVSFLYHRGDFLPFSKPADRFGQSKKELPHRAFAALLWLRWCSDTG